MSIPRAQFLPSKPLTIRPRSSRQRREEMLPAPGKWKHAVAITLITIGILATVYLAFDCAMSALIWYRLHP